MRIVAFLTYLSFLLLGGKDFAAVNSNQNHNYFSNQNLKVDRQIKITTEDFSITVIEDLDLEEEFHTDNSNSSSENTFFVGKYSLINTLYSTNFQHFFLNYFNTFNKISRPITGNSNPIYITQRVLRI